MTPPTTAPYAADFWHDEGLGFSLDLSDMHLSADWRAALAPAMARAFDAMQALESGAVANPDEGRQVGHYWLRDPSRAPDPALAAAIAHTRDAVLSFAEGVRGGTIRAGASGAVFRRVIVAGIGGSALGPLLVSAALARAGDPISTVFLDNTDPDGIAHALAVSAATVPLAETLAVVISKSGGTAETRNALRLLEAAYRAAGMSFAAHAVAVTGAGSALDREAESAAWIARFPMWDWVGGRTSLCSAVGLLPGALEGHAMREFLDGARAMDALTRRPVLDDNPAALLALAWHHAGRGRGDRAMVVLPYKDRLSFAARYLQQLVMESLGKAHDLAGRPVFQGLTVYGNKGSTDQHAYIQQLRDGRDDFFAAFIEVLRDREDGLPDAHAVEPGVTSGDYLFGFLEGTRRALSERGRPSLTLTLPDVSARSVGAFIALFERAVGLYAELVGLNAYHQPGVEAGKRAASAVIALQGRCLAALGDAPMRTEEVAQRAGGDAGTVFRLLRRLSANGWRGVIAEGPMRPDAVRWRRRGELTVT